MALSNWDTLAVDETGQATNGVFESPLGVKVQIYKNWLYVTDPRAWREGGAFVANTIMEVNEGYLRYLDISIWAKRGLKNGVYAVVWTHKYNPFEVKCMIGIGCSGYKDQVEEQLKKLGRLLECSDAWCSGSGSDGKHFIHNFETGEYIVYHDEKTDGPYDYDDDWTGIEQSEIDFLKKEILLPWRSNEHCEEIVPETILDNALRFNQGDMYILNACGMDESGAVTKIGEGDTPILLKMCAEMDKKSNE
jgi:hypothetical protein